MILSKPTTQIMHPVKSLHKDPLQRYEPGLTSQTVVEGPRHLNGVPETKDLTGLRAVHYEKMAQKPVVVLPEKPVAAIPGYGGFVPRKESMNILGCTYAKGNETAVGIWEHESALRSSRLMHDEESAPASRGSGVGLDDGQPITH
uniref:Uncharacterized protein n=1 Tax=Oxyrrhis marina TaxID=2969 RepID=A0A7S3UKN5_OXYMA